MKKGLLALVALVCVAAVHAQGTFGIQRVRQIHAQFTSVALKNNYAALEKLVLATFTPGFKYQMTPTQSQDRATWLKGLKQSLTASKITGFKFSNEKGSMKNGRGIVTGNLMVTAKGKGPDGKAHTFETAEKFQETWVRSGKAWKLDIVKSLGVIQKMDGKPIRMNATKT